jgi:hypothetical protein
MVTYIVQGGIAMKKIVSIIAIYFLVSTNTIAAISSSIVSLSGGGNVSPATSLSLSLNGLVPSVTYSVVCYIDTTYPFQYVLFGSSFSDSTSTITSYSLNGTFVMQAQLIAGHNIVVIQGQFTNPATGNIVFTNLDQVNPFNVNNCFGIPIQV